MNSLYPSLENNFFQYNRLEDTRMWPGILSNTYYWYWGLGHFYWMFNPYLNTIYGYANLNTDNITQDINPADSNQTDDSVIASLDFQTIEKGIGSRYSRTFCLKDDEIISFTLEEPTLFIVKTQEELEDFWAKHRGFANGICPPHPSYPTPDSNDVPSIDFEKELIIAVIDKGYSQELNYSIEIENLLIKDGNLMVEATKTGPLCSKLWEYFYWENGPWTGPAYHIIKISKDDRYKSFSLSLDDQSINIVASQDFQTILFGIDSNYPCLQSTSVVQPLYGPTLVKIENKQELDDFLMKYCNTSMSDISSIDFEKELILALVDRDYCAQYAIKINHLLITDEEVIVETAKTGPVTCYVPYFFRQLHMIKTAKINKEFRLCY